MLSCSSAICRTTSPLNQYLSQTGQRCGNRYLGSTARLRIFASFANDIEAVECPFDLGSTVGGPCADPETPDRFSVVKACNVEIYGRIE